jgi:hypothetical protein
VAAIVLNYNGREVTLTALESLTRMDYPAYDLLVVDNGSTDGSYAAIAAAFPDVHQLRVEDNVGPAGGGNLGIRWALARDYDYLLILNNDIEVAPDMLTELVRCAESDPAIGCVGPKAYYYDDRQRLWSAGGELRFREAVTRERGQRELDHGQYDRDTEVDYVNGCAMLVKRAACEAAGIWDESFFLGVEDADFCLRVRAAGYRCWYAHRAKLWHMVSVTAGGYVAGRTFHSGRNTALFVRRHGNAGQRLASLLAMAAAIPVAYLRELPKGNQKAVVAKLKGYWQGLREPLPAAPRPVRTSADSVGNREPIEGEPAGAR